MSSDNPTPQAALTQLGKTDPKSITEEEWKKVLTPEEFEVTRKAGTEPKGTGKYTNVFVSGKYICKCCGIELFVSDSKFRTTCGWPAFAESVGKDKNIVRLDDFSYGLHRIEVRCKNCDAHLGHVFDEDTAPSGERYCINSCSIELIPEKK